MAGFLQKFAQGVSRAGAAYYGAKAEEDYKQKLLAKRDEALRAQRMEEREAADSAAMARLRAQQEYSSSEAERQRAAVAESPASKLGEQKFEQAAKLQELKDQYMVESDPAKKKDILEMIKIQSGKTDDSGSFTSVQMKDAQALVDAGEASSLKDALMLMKSSPAKPRAVDMQERILDQYNALVKQTADNPLIKINGKNAIDAGQSDYMKEAKRLVEQSMSMSTGAPADARQDSKDQLPYQDLSGNRYYTIRSKSDYDLLRPGDFYYDASNNKFGLKK